MKIVVIVLLILLVSFFVAVYFATKAPAEKLPPYAAPPTTSDQPPAEPDSVIIGENNIDDHYLFQPGMMSVGYDIACNQDLDFTTALNKCYTDPLCKSVNYTANGICRKTIDHSTSRLPSNSVYGDRYGLYLKR